jgi:hypothetical protein
MPNEVADEILHRALAELVDAGLDPLAAASVMAETALREMPHVACCGPCLAAALRAVGEQLDAQTDELLEAVAAEAQPVEEKASEARTPFRQSVSVH